MLQTTLQNTVEILQKKAKHKTDHFFFMRLAGCPSHFPADKQLATPHDPT